MTDAALARDDLRPLMFAIASLLNVFKEELPSTRRSHYGWFVDGLSAYALLLGAVTALESAS